MKEIEAEKRWVLCPLCGAKTRLQLLPETELKAFPLFSSIEKLISGWVASHAEVNLAKRYLEVTLTNIFQDIDMLPTVNYNVNALPMRRIGQH